MTIVTSTALELDDIQRGLLQTRPSPYAGTYLLLRMQTRDAGRRPSPRVDRAGRTLATRGQALTARVLR